MKQKHREFHSQENFSLNAGLVKLKLLVTNGNGSTATKGRHAKFSHYMLFDGSQLASNTDVLATQLADLLPSAAEYADSSSLRWHKEAEERRKEAGGKK